MVFGLFGRRKDPAIPVLYAAIVAQARQPVFYAEFDVPDTVAGRFNMIVAHLILYCGRFHDADLPMQAKVQAVLDHFFTDMDHSMREMGISDTGVPRQMKKIAGAYLGQTEAYGPALAAGDTETLGKIVARNIYQDDNHGPASLVLARYFLASRAALARLTPEALLAETFIWPVAARFQDLALLPDDSPTKDASHD